MRNLGAVGVLVSDKERFLLLGSLTITRPGREKPHNHRLPVGNYRALFLAVDFGPLSLAASPADRIIATAGTGQPPLLAYPIKVRKDKPCTLDFSTKPTVIFTSPRGEQTFKPGDTVRFEAFLVEPAWNLMIGGLTYRDKETKSFTTGPKGERIPPAYPLNPIVENQQFFRREGGGVASCPLAEGAPAGTRGEYRRTSSCRPRKRRSRPQSPLTPANSMVKCRRPRQSSCRSNLPADRNLE